MIERPINTIEEYLSTIADVESKIQQHNQDIIHRDYFYRGERKKYPSVLSSLYQIRKPDGEVVVRLERALIEEARTRFPEIVKDCDDNVEMLLKFQHYGLPTRLLDVTQNPLVALYFACNDYDKDDCEDGRVMICTSNVTPYSLVQSIGELIGVDGVVKVGQIARISGRSKYPIGLNEDHSIKLLLNLIDKPLLFRPPQTDTRIKVQLGAFIFTPIMKFIKNDSVVDMPFDIEGMDNREGDLEKMFEDTIITVPKEKKESIIDYLDKIGVSEASLFPDNDHKMHYIKSHHMRFQKYDWHLDVSSQ